MRTRQQARLLHVFALAACARLVDVWQQAAGCGLAHRAGVVAAGQSRLPWVPGWAQPVAACAAPSTRSGRCWATSCGCASCCLTAPACWCGWLSATPAPAAAALPAPENSTTQRLLATKGSIWGGGGGGGVSPSWLSLATVEAAQLATAARCSLQVLRASSCLQQGGGPSQETCRAHHGCSAAGCGRSCAAVQLDPGLRDWVPLALGHAHRCHITELGERLGQLLHSEAARQPDARV